MQVINQASALASNPTRAWAFLHRRCYSIFKNESPFKVDRPTFEWGCTFKLDQLFKVNTCLKASHLWNWAHFWKWIHLKLAQNGLTFKVDLPVPWKLFLFFKFEPTKNAATFKKFHLWHDTSFAKKCTFRELSKLNSKTLMV